MSARVLMSALLVCCTAAPAPKPAAAPVCSAAAKPVCPAIDKTDKPPEDKPCEPAWAANAGDVSVAWNSCPDPLNRFMSRGFPALSKDGKRVAYADHFSGNNSWFIHLTVRIIDVDTDKPAESLVVVGQTEFNEPSGLTAADRATIDARLATANQHLLDFETFYPPTCGAPEPYPNDRLGAPCMEAKRAPQIVACGNEQHLWTIELRASHVALARDGKRFLDRDVTAWAQHHGTRVYEPIMVEARMDFARRAAVVLTQYCNTMDSDPFFASVWHAFRLPK